jgi:hypothetical protein
MKQLKTPFKITWFHANDVAIAQFVDSIKLYENSAKKKVPFTGRYRIVKKGIEFELRKGWIIKKRFECKRVKFNLVKGD